MEGQNLDQNQPNMKQQQRQLNIMQVSSGLELHKHNQITWPPITFNNALDNNITHKILAIPSYVSTKLPSFV